MALEIVDDDQLIELARKPPAALFPALQRPSPLAPLLLLICVLPPLYATIHRTLSESDALWAMRAIERPRTPWDMRRSTTADGATSPNAAEALANEGAAAALRWQPPLGSWLSAGLLRLPESTAPIRHVVVSLTFAAAGVALFVLLMRTLFNPRVAFWSGLLGGFQAAQIGLAGRCAPSSVGVFFFLATFAAFLSAIGRTPRRPRGLLLTGGLALGAAFLSGGPTALGVVTILLLHVLGLRGQSLSREFSEPKPVDVWAGLPALRSLGVVAFVGSLIGGSWLVALARADGTDFWPHWLLGTPDVASAGIRIPTNVGDADGFAPEVAKLGRLVAVFGPLFGLSLLGLLRAVVATVVSEDEPRRRGQQFLLLWMGTTLAGWSATTASPNAGAFVIEQWEALLGLALTGLAAVAVDDIVARQIAVKWAAAIAAPGAVALTFAGWAREIPEAFREGGLLAGLMLVGAAAAASWKLLDGSIDRDHRRRFLLGTIIAAHVAATVIYGLRSARRETPDDRALGVFRRGLPAGEDVAEILLIGSPSRMPLRVRQVVRTAFPGADERFAESWDAVLARALAEPSDKRRTLLAVDWQARDGRSAAMQASGVHVSPSLSVQILDGGTLRAFLVRRASD